MEGCIAAVHKVIKLALDVIQKRGCSHAEQVGLSPFVAELILHQREPNQGILGASDAPSRLEADFEVCSLKIFTDCSNLKERLAGTSPKTAESCGRTMQNPVSKVALTPSFPVDVLMKSAPAIMHTSDACITFCIVPHSPVARITLMCALPQASRMSRVSLAGQHA